MTLYETIKDLAEKKNMSICDLERAADVGNGIIGKWKTARPRLDRLEAVAKALDMTAPELLLLVDTEEEQPHDG